MDVLFIASLALIMSFGFVLVFGAPYLPTLTKQADQALDLLNLKAGQTMLELGSGDGRVLIAAAKRGIKCVGYELNPILVLISKIRCWRYRKLINIKWANYWSADWPKSEGMYVFLLDKYMDKLDKKIIQYSRSKPYKLVSFNFKIVGKKSLKSKSGLHLYNY